MDTVDPSGGPQCIEQLFPVPISTGGCDSTAQEANVILEPERAAPARADLPGASARTCSCPGHGTHPEAQQRSRNLALTLERLKTVLFIPAASQLHLPDSEASVLSALDPDVAIGRAHVLLQHLPEAPTYRLLRLLPGSLLARPFHDVFSHLLALVRALRGASVGELLELAVWSPQLLAAEPEAMVRQVDAVVQAAATRLRATRPEALVQAMVRHRPELLQTPPGEVEARMAVIQELADGLSGDAARMAEDGYASDAAARRLAGWLCGDFALQSRLESLRGGPTMSEDDVAGPCWAHLDGLSDLWLHQCTADSVPPERPAARQAHVA